MNRATNREVELGRSPSTEGPGKGDLTERTWEVPRTRFAVAVGDPQPWNEME